MKKTVFKGILFALLLSAASAYNPPVNGENFYELSSPRLLSTSSSSCGGPIYYVSPDSVVANPALGASEQLVKLNFGYTALLSFDKSDSHHFGSALQTGVIIPTKLAVFTGYLNGVFSPFDNMNLGYSFNTKLGLAKEITDSINVGINLNSGVLWGAATDWSLSANIGMLYSVEKLGFIKDFRYGLSIMNLGKNYTQNNLAHPIDGTSPAGMFPTLCYVRTGVAGLLVSTDPFKLGFALDVSTPLMQNVIVDGAIQMGIKDTVYINVAERFNMAEFTNGHRDLIPAVSIGVKLNFRFDDNAYLSSKGWEEIQVDGYGAYKLLYEDISAVSVGADVSFGKRDVTPPVIQIFLDDDGDDE